MITAARTIAHHRPVTSSLGERFEATMTNRQVTIGVGSKSLRFTMRSSRFHRSVAPLRDAQGSALWRAMGYVGCASLALGLVFVSGSMLRASPPIAAYAVVMPIDAKTVAAPPRHQAKPRRLARAHPATKPMPAIDSIENWSLAPASDIGDLGAAIERPAPDVAALPTVNGERAVAVYGPSRTVGGKSCRAVSVFVRGIDGRVSVSPTTECKAAR